MEVLEAHFGVGIMDFEVLKFSAAHGIHPVSFSSLSEVAETKKKILFVKLSLDYLCKYD